jgi:hypothetical protein
MSQPSQPSLSWSFSEDGGLAFTFHPTAWDVVRAVAEQEGRDPVDMIYEPVERLFGTILLKYHVGP